MAETNDPRFGGRLWSADSDTFSRDELNTSLTLLYAKAAIFGQGTLANRPAAAVPGRHWWVVGDSTASNNGRLWYDDGTTWTLAAESFANLQLALADAMPIGAIIPYGGSTAPSANWLLGQGQAVSRSTYATLFSRFGTTYGAGDGATTFNLPNPTDRFLTGSGGSRGARGATGGASTKTLAIANLPSHSHPHDAHSHGVSDGGHSHDNGIQSFQANVTTGGGLFIARLTYAGNRTSNDATGVSLSSVTTTEQAVGSGTALDVLNPWLAVPHIVKVL